jgi:hypothetical protein
VKKREYQPIKPMSRLGATKALASSDPEQVSSALLSLAIHDSDWQWVQEVCLSALGHESYEVHATAALCVSHLARLHHYLDLDRVLPALDRLKTDARLSGRVEDVLDDLWMSLPAQRQQMAPRTHPPPPH